MEELQLKDIYSNNVGNTHTMLFRNTKRGLSVQMNGNYYTKIILYPNETIEEYFRRNNLPFNKRIYDMTVEEVNNFLNKETDKILNSSWWKNDAYLVQFYQDLYNQINECLIRMKTNPLSRNNVACNKNCCYSWFNFSNDKLIIHCRSTDAYFGLKSDLIAFMLIAQMAYDKNDYIYIYITYDNLHYYLKTDSLARRKQ